MNYLTGLIGIASLVHIGSAILVVEYLDSSFVTLLFTFAAFAVFLGVFGWVIYTLLYEEEFNLRVKLTLLWGIVIAGYVLDYSFFYDNLSLLTWFTSQTLFNKVLFLVKGIAFPIYISLFFLDIFKHQTSQESNLKKSMGLLEDYVNKIPPLKEEVVIIEQTPLLSQDQREDNKIITQVNTLPMESSQNPEYTNGDVFHIQVQSLYGK